MRVSSQLLLYDLAPVTVGTPTGKQPNYSPQSSKPQEDVKGDKIQIDRSFQKQSAQGLSEDELKQLEKLKKRDQVVRAHERAHIAAGGPYVRGGARYVYQRGPDGRLYAIGGEVSIDVSPVPNDPEATIRKMQVIKRAALAPAQPSPQDYHIAAQAAMEMQKAQAELNRMKANVAYSSSNGNFETRGVALSLVA